MTISNANFYHNAAKPKLTYLLEINSIVICDFDVGAEALLTVFAAARPSPRPRAGPRLLRALCAVLVRRQFGQEANLAANAQDGGGRVTDWVGALRLRVG
jgi:hypothetical protein